MLSIKRSKVPVYLRKSDFYKSLSEEDDEEITIPKCNMKPNTKVASTADLAHILSTARFWGLNVLPEPALQYAMYSCDEGSFQELEDFEDIYKTIACLKHIRLAEGEEKILAAAEYGRLDFIRYLQKMGDVLKPIVGVRAASNNHLSCLEYITRVLLETDSKPYKQTALHHLSPSMNYSCWTHLHHHGAKLDRQSVTKAAGDGNLACLQFVHERKAKVTKQTMIAALTNGHAACAAFIHEEGKVAMDVEFAVVAAANGHLDCLKYLFEHGCPKANKISTAAAHGGDLECLKYTHEQGCTINRTTMMSTKSLDCIKYMRAQKVKWDQNIYTFALRESRLDCLQYAHENGCEWDQCTFGSAMHRGRSQNVVDYLVYHKCPRTAEETKEQAGSVVCDCSKVAEDTSEGGASWPWQRKGSAQRFQPKAAAEGVSTRTRCRLREHEHQEQESVANDNGTSAGGFVAKRKRF